MMLGSYMILWSYMVLCSYMVLWSYMILWLYMILCSYMVIRPPFFLSAPAFTFTASEALARVGEVNRSLRSSSSLRFLPLNFGAMDPVGIGPRLVSHVLCVAQGRGQQR